MAAILKGINSDHILSIQKSELYLAWNPPFTQRSQQRGMLARDSAYMGEIETRGQVKFMVHVQETDGNSKEDKIFLKKEPSRKVCIKCAQSTLQLLAVSSADCRLRPRHYKPRIFRVNFI